MQVFNAANAWLNHKRIERNKHAKYLLQRVRFSLLTIPALNNILDNNLWITENVECTDVINKAIRNKKPPHSETVKSINRYCSQENFNILLVGGKNCENKILRNAFTIDAYNLSLKNNLSPFKHKRKFLKVVCVKGEMYVFNAHVHGNLSVMDIEKYSPVTNAWDVIGQMYDRRRYYCACSFIDSFYVLGGVLNNYTNSCLVFNTTNKTWREVAGMYGGRDNASCAVFEGRIVITGGYNAIDGTLNTVEAYDHIDDSWEKMPSMNVRRCCHNSVVIKNKLFVVGDLSSQTNEVFDSCSKKFALLQHPSINLRPHLTADVTSIGNKLIMFSNYYGSVFIYDVENEVWSEKSCEATKHIKYFSCASLPQ